MTNFTSDKSTEIIAAIGQVGQNTDQIEGLLSAINVLLQSILVSTVESIKQEIWAGEGDLPKECVGFLILKRSPIAIIRFEDTQTNIVLDESMPMLNFNATEPFVQNAICIKPYFSQITLVKGEISWICKMLVKTNS